jgi:hypothetical protein
MAIKELNESLLFQMNLLRKQRKARRVARALSVIRI